jgi:hypothetical protein
MVAEGRVDAAGEVDNGKARGGAVRAKGEIVGVAWKRLRGKRDWVGEKRKGFRAKREVNPKEVEWVPGVLRGNPRRRGGIPGDRERIPVKRGKSFGIFGKLIRECERRSGLRGSRSDGWGSQYGRRRSVRNGAVGYTLLILPMCVCLFIGGSNAARS